MVRFAPAPPNGARYRKPPAPTGGFHFHPALEQRQAAVAFRPPATAIAQVSEAPEAADGTHDHCRRQPGPPGR